MSSTSRAGARRALDAHLAIQQVGALAQAHEAVGALRARPGGLEAAAVVAHGEDHRARAALERDLHARGRGVACDVGERFLQHAEHCGRPRVGQVELARAQHQLARRAGALAEVLHQPFARGGEAEVVQHQRAQVGRDAARGGDGGIEQLLHGGELVRERARRRLEVLAQPPHVDLQRRERLAQLVVQLARDAPLLLLAHRACREGEAADLLARGAQVLLGAHALGDVAQDHRVVALAALLDVRDRGVDGKLLAVAAQAPHDALAAHAPRASCPSRRSAAPARGGRRGSARG